MQYGAREGSATPCENPGDSSTGTLNYLITLVVAVRTGSIVVCTFLKALVVFRQLFLLRMLLRTALDTSRGRRPSFRHICTMVYKFICLSCPLVLRLKRVLLPSIRTLWLRCVAKRKETQGRDSLWLPLVL